MAFNALFQYERQKGTTGFKNVQLKHYFGMFPLTL